jgi:hypothetical protein
VDKEGANLALCCGQLMVLSFSLSLAFTQREKRNCENAVHTTTFIFFIFF